MARIAKGLGLRSFKQKLREQRDGETGERPVEYYDEYHNGAFIVPVSGQFLIYIIFIVLLFLILYVFLRSSRGINKSFRHYNSHISFDEIEDNLEESDLDKLLKKSLSKGDYLMAIRILYLDIIKSLSLKGLIEWHKHKTNRDYLFELTNDFVRERFDSITKLFEWVWYGEIVLDRDIYNRLEPKFKDFLNKIKDFEE